MGKTRSKLSSLSILTSAAIVASVFSAGASGALAAPAAAPAAALPAAPAVPTTPDTVSSDALPTAQINGVVWDQEIVGDTVYVGGNFSTAQPAGAAAGASTVARGNLLAYNVKSGQLISSFAPMANAEVLAVAASPDKSRIYVGGTFTSINGQTRYRMAAFDARTGELIPSFAPILNAKVQAIATVGDTVYIGGVFSSVNNVTRVGAAALNASTGALLDWAPKPAGGNIQALVVSPDRSKVVLGGSFTSVNGSTKPGYGLAAVDSTRGDILPWNVNNLIRNGGSQAAILSLAADNQSVYGSGYVFGNGGNLEGAFRADWAKGDVVWVADCHGDTYSVAPKDGALYTASHAHYCGTIGGFPETSPRSHHHGLAFTTEPTGTVTRNPYGGYANFEGNPAPSLLNWFPDFNTGTFTGSNQGPWSVATSDQYVVYGGEFTTVNNKRQQGLVRFAVKPIAPNQDGPRLGGSNLVPTATSFAAGTARISWTSNWDRDDAALTYSLIRDNDNGSPVFTTTRESTFWNRPIIQFVDTGLTPGQNYSYKVRTTDAAGNSAWGDNVTVTASKSGTVSQYSADVMSDNPMAYWPLDESSGAAFDWAAGNDSTVGSGVTRSVAGALVGDASTAYRFGGTSTGFAAAKTASPGVDTFSAEAWFNTTTKRGGKIVGFGNSTGANSSSYDRHVYMDNTGHLIFGVYNGATDTITSPGSYNDGAWHHVVATLGSNGMQLFVDGKRVAQRADATTGQAYSGVWHIGGDNLASWPNRPASDFFAGSIDAVAIYPAVLDQAQIDRHYARGTGAPVIDPVDPPVDPPIDPVDPPAVPATDAADSFGRTVTGGWGSADAGGAWTVSGGASNFSVTGGVGKISSPKAGGIADAALKTVSLTDAEMRVTTALPGAVTGSGVYVTAAARQVGDDFYGARLRFLDTGQVNLQAMRKTGALDQIALPGLTYSPGDKINVRVQVTGTSPTTVRAKAWKVGAQEPTAWQVSATDNTAALQKAGHVGVSVYLGGSVTNAPVVTEFDDLVVGAPNPNDTDQPAEPGPADPEPNQPGAPDAERAADAFGRTVSGGWGSADAGGPWVLTGGASNYSVAGGVAKLSSPRPGGTMNASLPSVSRVDTEVKIATRLPQQVTGSGVYVTVVGRETGSDFYGARLRFLDTGQVNLQAMHKSTALDQLALPGTSYKPGDQMNVRLQVVGTSPTTIRAKAWKAGSSEPASWQVSATDNTSALQNAGSVGLSVYLGGSVTTVPTIVEFDDFSAGPIEGDKPDAPIGGDEPAAGTTVLLTAKQPGATVSAYPASPTTSSIDVQAAFALEQPPTGSGIYVSTIARKVGSDDYQARVRVFDDRTMTLQLMNGSATLAAQKMPGLTYSDADRLIMRVQATDTSPTTIRAKVWKKGTTEPDAWMLTATDSAAALQKPGVMGLSVYLGGSATNAPSTVTFSDITVKEIR